MNLSTQNFDAYAFSKQPDYDEPTFRKEFAKAMPLRTVLVVEDNPDHAQLIGALFATGLSNPQVERPVGAACSGGGQCHAS